MIAFITKDMSQVMSQSDFARRPKVQDAIKYYNISKAAEKGIDIRDPKDYKKYVKIDKDMVKYNPKARTALAFAGGALTGALGGALGTTYLPGVTESVSSLGSKIGIPASTYNKYWHRCSSELNY